MSGPEFDPLPDMPWPEPFYVDTFKLGESITSTAEFATEHHDVLTDRLTARLTAYVFGRSLPTLTREFTALTETEVPATWWQHWKLAHQHHGWIGAAIRRWSPPRTTIVQQIVTLTGSVERAALFPEAPAMNPGGAIGRPFLVLRQPSWDPSIRTHVNHPRQDAT